MKKRTYMNIRIESPVKLAFALSAIIASLVSGQVNASLLNLKWDQQGHFQHRGEIKAGGILEVCGKLSAGTKIDWQYQSAKPVDFNIHFHEGKKVTLPVKYQARDTAAEQFEVKQSQDYCWMWSNKSKEAVMLDLSLSQVQK